MSVWSRISHWLREKTFLVDAVAAGLAVAVVGGIYLLVGIGYSPEQPGQIRTVAFAGLMSVLMIATLAWRRTRPGIAMWVLAGLCVASLPFSWLGDTAGVMAVPFMIYGAATYGKRWQGRAALGLGLLGAVLFTFSNYWGRGRTLDRSDIPTITAVLVSITLLVLFSWTLGSLTRSRRLRLKELEDRARRLELENEQERQLAAADERAHIAREMHDIVAHSLSVIISQADGGRYAAVADPAQGLQALETIASAGRSSLAEMRRLLGVLRTEEDTDYRPQPGLVDIAATVAALTNSGLNIDFEESGKARRALPAGAELTAYRVVQEALTNCLKHAGPNTKVRARMEWTLRGLSISVHDDGRGAAADPPAPGGGHGLRGMEERLALYDGTVTAGPRKGGGFSVLAAIPYSEA